MSISERFSTICGNYPAWYWIEFPRLQQSLKNVCEEDVRRRDFYLRQEMLCLSMGPILKAENWNPIGREERKWTFCMDNYVCLRDGGVERHLWWSDKSDGVIEPRLGGGGRKSDGASQTPRDDEVSGEVVPTSKQARTQQARTFLSIDPFVFLSLSRFVLRAPSVFPSFYPPVSFSFLMYRTQTHMDLSSLYRRYVSEELTVQYVPCSSLKCQEGKHAGDKKGRNKHF